MCIGEEGDGPWHRLVRLRAATPCRGGRSGRYSSHSCDGSRNRCGGESTASYFPNVKRARCTVPSRNVTTRSRQLPLHAFAVVARYV